MSDTQHAAAKLSGDTKAAILIVLLGEEVSGAMFKHLSRREVARIARKVAQLGPIDPTVAEDVLNEYYLAALQGPPDQGGPDIARRILAHASIPEEIADQFIGHDPDTQDEVLGPLLEAPPDVLAKALQDEHPQTTALVLLYLPAKRAAKLLRALPDEARTETVLRMVTLKHVRGEVLDEVATSLHERLSAQKGQDAEDGLGRTSTVLASLDRSITKTLLDEMEKDHPDEAASLRDNLFTFESLITADDRGMQELLRSVDSSRLGLALAGVDDTLRDRFLGNLSERAAGMLKEEIEFMGKPAPKDQAEAQKEILDLALKLEADGNLVFQQIDGEEEDETTDS